MVFPDRGLEVEGVEIEKVGRGAIFATIPPPTALLPPPPIEPRLLTELEALIPARKVLPMGLAPLRVGVTASEEPFRAFSELSLRESFLF